MGQRKVMEAGYLTNCTPNISALDSKHFINYQLKKERKKEMNRPLPDKRRDYTTEITRKTFFFSAFKKQF